jgi:hypothetical protein
MNRQMLGRLSFLIREPQRNLNQINGLGVMPPSVQRAVERLYASVFLALAPLTPGRVSSSWVG